MGERGKLSRTLFFLLLPLKTTMTGHISKKCSETAKFKL